MTRHGFYEDGARTLQRNEDRAKRQKAARREDAHREMAARRRRI